MRQKAVCAPGIYEGPDEKSIREAASANKITVDYIVEIPVVLTPR